MDHTGPREQGFRPSPQQTRVWRLQQDGLTPCASLCMLRIEGNLDRPALRRALAETVARYEILRTAFRLPAGLTAPLQVILEPEPVALPEVDLRSLAQESRPDTAAELLATLGRLRLDLDRGKVWRAALLQLGPREHRLLLAISAACADAGTFKPLMADLFAAYARQVAGGGEAPEPPLQYADVAEWQNSLFEEEDTAKVIEAWREHWRRHEIDAQLVSRFPLEEDDAAAGPFVPREIAISLSRETAGTLARLADLWGTPLPVVVLAAWKVVLQRGTGRAETLVGLLSAGREADELRDLVGPLSRYLPVVCRLDLTTPLQTAAAQVREAVAEAQRRGECFSWDHVAGSGHAAGGFPVCFEVAPQRWEVAVDGLRVAPVRLPWASAVFDSFALALTCDGEGEELQLALRYDPRRFRADVARRLAGRLAVLLSAVVARPEAPLTEHPALAYDERRGWLELSVAPPADARGREGKTLHALFEEQVDRAPERPAVVAGEARLSFAELDVQSNRLAHHLRAAGAEPEVPVALCLERSAEALVALLAVWKAGAFYVPLDPGQPAERLAYILSDTGAPLLVTDSRLAASLPGGGALPGVRTVRIDEEAADIAAQPAARPAAGAGPRNLAYAIYTSGSTGRPKGVQIEHRSPLCLLAALEAAVLEPWAGARPLLASLNAPMIFDASVQQLVLLLAGHALCVVPEETRADGAAMVDLLRQERVELLDCTPSQLRVLVDAGLLDGPAGPRIVLTAGEAVDEPLWRRLARAERTVSFNLYGPTECTVDATFHRIEPGSADAGGPTIGRPLAGYEVFLLDPYLQPVPPGAAGEICLGGEGLARGYLRRPDLSAERFVPHPFAQQPGQRLYRTGDLGRHLPDGNLEFLGRLDFQVKLRGFRIELGEIEAVLLAQAGVREAAVVVHEESRRADRSPSDQRLVAYVAGEAVVDPLRQALRERLPDYMVPAVFVTLPALPLTPSGKVDRKALPAPQWHGSNETYLAPHTPVEEILAGIWAELLGLERVGAADHFFERGGHSLLATQVMSHLRDAFDIEMPLRALFEAPVLADLAARIEAARRTGETAPAQPLIPVPRHAPLPLSFAQQRLWFIDQLKPGTSLYNIPVVLRGRGPLRLEALEACLGEIVRRHEALRTVFAKQEGSPVQVIRPPAPFVLPVVDLSGLPERKREAQAVALAGEETGRPFDLARGPLLRGVLLRLAEDHHIAALTMHHIVSDGWSMGILVREVMALYGSLVEGKPSPLSELTVQYGDFAVWQHGWLDQGVLEGLVEHWRRRLAGAPPQLDLPGARPRPAVPSSRGTVREQRFAPPLLEELRALGRRESATLFMVLLAPLQALLHARTGATDLVVGTDVAGRDRRETEGLIGFFINQLPLRADMTGDPTLRELLERVRETALEAYAHQDLPFDHLVEALRVERSLQRSPVFQVKLVLQNIPRSSLELPGLSLEVVPSEIGTAQLDLHWSFAERGEDLWLRLTYSTDLYDELLIDGLLAEFERWLHAFVERPEARLGEVAAELAQAERARREELDTELRSAGLAKLRSRRLQVAEGQLLGVEVG